MNLSTDRKKIYKNNSTIKRLRLFNRCGVENLTEKKNVQKQNYCNLFCAWRLYFYRYRKRRRRREKRSTIRVMCAIDLRALLRTFLTIFTFHWLHLLTFKKLWKKTCFRSLFLFARLLIFKGVIRAFFPSNFCHIFDSCARILNICTNQQKTANGKHSICCKVKGIASLLLFIYSFYHKSMKESTTTEVSIVCCCRWDSDERNNNKEWEKEEELRCRNVTRYASLFNTSATAALHFHFFFFISFSVTHAL